MTTSEQHERFVELYQTDPEFHAQVDQVVWGEVADLRLALIQITSLRREQFRSGFHYELAVRTTADYALRRLEQSRA